jgi:hypothetical protein
MNYKFNEEQILGEIKKYIDTTYTEHYAKGNGEIQAFELMLAGSSPRALYFAAMSALKYADRFGSKEGFNEKDLFKIVHFGMMAIFALRKLKSKNVNFLQPTIENKPLSEVELLLELEDVIDRIHGVDNETEDDYRESMKYNEIK